MHPCFITYDVKLRHWWGLLQTTLCFPVTAQPDWFMCIPLGQRKTFLSCSVTPHSTWYAIPPCTAACEMTCKYISMTFACNGCLSKLCHDRCDGRESVWGPNRYALISVSTTVFDESANSVLNANSTMVSSLKSLLCYFRSFSKVATKLSCLSLLLDKVCWTFNIILNFEDDLGP